MPSPPHIDLVAKLNRARERPDYDVFAAEQQVGRIYLMHTSSKSESWWWGVNGVTVDGTIGAEMKGYAHSLEQAREAFRAAFDRWLDWALAMPSWDLKHKHIRAELTKMGAA